MNELKPKHFDVIVIGAGPAGAMAAIEAAKGGVSVAIIEKTGLPRRKVCAGGLFKRAVDMIPKDIKYPVEQKCNAIGMSLQDHDTQFLAESQELVTMVCRSAFDMALVDHAKGLGIKVFSETKIQTIEPQKDTLNIISKQHHFTCSYLVFAEGAMGTLSNQFWADDRVLIPALEADVYPADMESYKHAIIDFGEIQGGYAWVFPKGDHLSVGLGAFSKKSTIKLQDALDQYLQKLGLAKNKITNRKGFIVPLTSRKEPLMKGRMMLVGDAAGLADPFTAEGLTHAIQSGMGAGRAISSFFNSPKDIAKIYTLETVQPILDELRVAHLLAKVIYHPSTILRNMLFKHYGNRLCNGMTGLAEGKRTYASSLKKHKFLSAIIKKASA